MLLYSLFPNLHTSTTRTTTRAPPPLPRNLWERVQNIFDVNCTFEEYVTADDHGESSQPMTDEDIINAVHNHDNSSADSESSTPEDPDVTSDDDDNDDDDAENNEDGVAANESQDYPYQQPDSPYFGPHESLCSLQSIVTGSPY